MMPDLKSKECSNDSALLELAEKADTLSIDDYKNADEVKRSLEYFAIKYGKSNEPEVLK